MAKVDVALSNLKTTNNFKALINFFPITLLGIEP